MLRVASERLRVHFLRHRVRACFGYESPVKHTLTLTRWHKVAERINAAIKERDARVIVAFTAATISPWNKEGVEQKAASIAARAKGDLAIVEQGSAAVAAIRSALAR